MECVGASVGHATQDYSTGFGRRAVVRVGALVGWDGCEVHLCDEWYIRCDEWYICVTSGTF